MGPRWHLDASHGDENSHECPHVPRAEAGAAREAAPFAEAAFSWLPFVTDVGIFLT